METADRYDTAPLWDPIRLMANCPYNTADNWPFARLICHSLQSGVTRSENGPRDISKDFAQAHTIAECSVFEPAHDFSTCRIVSSSHGSVASVDFV